MHEVDITGHLIGFLADTIYLAGIPLLVATVVSLVIATLQAMTQIQDQNLATTVKIAAIVAVFVLFGSGLVQPILLRTERVLAELGNF